MSQFLSEHKRYQYVEDTPKTIRLSLLLSFAVALTLGLGLVLGGGLGIPLAILIGSVVFLGLNVIDALLNILTDYIARWANLDPIKKNKKSDEAELITKEPSIRQPNHLWVFSFIRSAPPTAIFALISALVLSLVFMFYMGVSLLTPVVFFWLFFCYYCFRIAGKYF